MSEELERITDEKHRYERAVQTFEQDQVVSQHNKELVLRFAREAALGKTVLNRARKRIGYSRLSSYFVHLTTVIHAVRKDLDAVTQEDMECFIEALDRGAITARHKLRHGRVVVTSHGKLSERYRVDLKVTLKKFYKWLWGNCKTYPAIVEWIDTYVEPKEISALTPTEVERMVDCATTILQRALIQVLFDGGFRLNELLNVRLEHVVYKRFDPQDATKACFVLRVPFSKTIKRTVALPMQATTKWLRLWLERHPTQPRFLPDGRLQVTQDNVPLFPMTGNAVRCMVKRAGEKALGKRVYPHLLRHTSATYWSNKLPWFKLCKRFGWAMTSSMPQRYIDREGVDELESAKEFLEDAAEQLERERDELRSQVARVEES
jgi:integrase